MKLTPTPSSQSALALLFCACLTLTACGGGGGGGDEEGLVAPLLTEYAVNPASYSAGQPIIPNVPVFNGGASMWTINPALPGGLSLDPLTGILSGVPTEALAPTVYTVQVTNDAGSDMIELEIEVTPEIFATAMEMVSRNAMGEPGTGGSSQPSISRNGRWAVFASFARNLVDDDSNFRQDVFKRDVFTGEIRRMSVFSNGSQVTDGASWDPSVSAEGARVAFVSESDQLSALDSNGEPDIYVRIEGLTNSTALVSVNNSFQVGDGISDEPSISPDGFTVAFRSKATNLVTGDTNAHPDIYVRDLQNNSTTRVSVASGGVEASGPSFEPAQANNGRTAFTSFATNLVSNDTNTVSDIFLYEENSSLQVTRRVSISTSGEEANGPSSTPAISPDGRFIVFMSDASNLVPGDTNGVTDIFLHDVLLATTERVSISTDGIQGNGVSRFPAVSDDGRYITFDSLADNLVPNDTNGLRDVFRHDRFSGATVRVSEAPNGTEGTEQSFSTSVSGNGERIVFISNANEFDGPSGGTNQVFMEVRGPLAVQEIQQADASVSIEAVARADRSAPLQVRRALKVDPADVQQIRIDTDGAWISANFESRRDAPTEELALTIEFLSSGLQSGVYETTVRVLGMHGDELAAVPVSLTVN